MELIKEPRDIDFVIQSEPWTDEELADFRKLMKELKAKNAKKKSQRKRFSGRKAQALTGR